MATPDSEIRLPIFAEVHIMLLPLQPEERAF